MTKFTSPTAEQILWEVVETTWELRWTIQMSVRQHRIFIKPKSEIQNKHTVILLSIEWFHYICHRIPVLICITESSAVFSFQFFFSIFRHFLFIFGPTCPSRTVLILLLSERSSSLSFQIKIHMDGCFVPTNRFHLLWNPESIRKTNNLKNHQLLVCASSQQQVVQFQWKKVNVITMESDFMRNRCCGCRTISDGLKETMYKTITEYHFACVLCAYFRK
jgi:hypothetical protein